MEKETKMKVKKIVLIGPESTGKTDLSKKLAAEFNTCYVHEYAREYIENLNRKYTYSDIEHIAKQQIAFENKMLQKANKILFYDTYLIITKVWFQVVYKQVPDWIESKIKQSKIDLFLLCNTDLPWEADPVRENGGEMRDKLFQIYKEELERYGFNYEIVSGIGSKREHNAITIIKEFLNKK